LTQHTGYKYLNDCIKERNPGLKKAVNNPPERYASGGLFFSE
jgi:hypothetical protein